MHQSLQIQDKNNQRYHEPEDECQVAWKYCVMFFCCPCYSVYYLLEAIWDYCLQPCCEKTLIIIERMLDCLCGFLERIFNFIFKYIAQCCHIIFSVIEKCCACIFAVIDACCKAIWKCIKPCVLPILHAIGACCVYIIQAIANFLSWFYRTFLKPIGNCLYSIMKFILKVGVEFGRCVNKYLLTPFYKALLLFYTWVIKPILKLIDYVILTPIKIVLKFFSRIIGKIWDFLDDIMIEICYDGYEYRKKKLEKEDRRMKTQRTIDRNSMKYSRKATNKQVPKEYMDFFGGNNDIAVQYMQSNVVPMPVPHYSGGVQHKSLGNQKSHNKQRVEDEENFFVCPDCKRKIPLTEIDTHQQSCFSNK